MRQLLSSLAVVLALAAFADARLAQAETGFRLLVPEDMFLMQARQIATALDHESDLKIFPVFGDGAVTAPQILTSYSDIGAVILPSDIPAYRHSQKLHDVDSLTYVARLDSLPIFLVARRDIANVSQLSGKRIATGPANSASFATGELVLGGANTSFLRVPLAGQDGLKALVSGKADAALILGRSPALALLPPGQFHLVALNFGGQVAEIYQPALITAAEAPNLLQPNETVETLASSLVIAVPTKAHNSGLTSFEQELLKFERRSGATNLAAEVPGWTRASGIAELLKQSAVTIQPTGGTP